MKKNSKKIWISIIIFIVTLNIVLLSTGKLYYYKALIYNYVNIDDLDLFPTRVVKASKAEPWPTSVYYNKYELSDTLTKTLESYESVAFVVIKNDSILHELYWDGYGAESYSNSFSMAKSYIGVLIGIAHYQGLIESLDDPVCKYLKEFCSGDRNQITIRHLLMMSSGLDWDEGYSSLTSPVTRLYYDIDLPGQMYVIKKSTTPGKEFNYMSCNTQLLGMILKASSGMSISSFASKNLWTKIGAELDARWSLDQIDGIEKSYCCLYSNARDFARLGKLYLQDGQWNGTQIVPAEFVKASVTPSNLTFNDEENKIYGYHWWITNRKDKKVYYARGILGQYIFVIPELQIICVRLGHKRGNVGFDGDLEDVAVYLDEVIDIFE